MNMPQDIVKVASGTALGRGLVLLEHLSMTEEAVRFSELQSLLSGVPDSTLTRLLRSLEALGYVSRGEGSGYLAGPGLLSWKAKLSEHPQSVSEVVDACVTDLVMTVHESVGVALLDEERFYMAASRTANDGINIAPKHTVMHYDSEHAAVLALFASLSKRKCQQLLVASPRLEESLKVFTQAQAVALREGDIYLDASHFRPGISRMAMAFKVGEIEGAVFLCLTQQRADGAFDELSSALRISCAQLEARLGLCI